MKSYLAASALAIAPLAEGVASSTRKQKLPDLDVGVRLIGGSLDLALLWLQGVQVGEQIADLGSAQDLSESRHLIAPKHNDVGDPLVVSRHSTHRQRWSFEYAL